MSQSRAANVFPPCVKTSFEQYIATETLGSGAAYQVPSIFAQSVCHGSVICRIVSGYIHIDDLSAIERA